MGINYDEKSCGVILFNELDGKREYLLLHYPSGHWDLPKGHVEKGETEEQTAKRELLEETGIHDVEILENFRVEISYKYMRNNNHSNKQVIFFLGKTNLSDIELSHEHQNFIWLDYKEAVKKTTFDNAKNLLKEAENFLAS